MDFYLSAFTAPGERFFRLSLFAAKELWKGICRYIYRVYRNGVGTLIMAVCHGAALPGTDAGSLLWQTDLPLILAEEGLEALSFCLAVYVVHCLLRKPEAGFLAVLAGRLILNFVTGGVRPGLPVQLAVNLAMTGLVFLMAFRDFAEKFIDS